MSFTKWDIGECCCGGCGACCADCNPCPIPKADLTLTVGASSLVNPGVYPVRYIAGSLPIWTTDCIPTGTGGSVFVVGCGFGTMLVKWEIFSSPSCSGVPIATYCWNSTGSGACWYQPLVTVCSPFSITCPFPGSGSPFVFTGPSNSPYGYPVCCQTFNVEGCAPLPGATVSVYDTMGGTLLTSAVTPSSGSVTLWWSGSCDVYVTATEPSGRFDAYGQSLSLTQAGLTTIPMPVNSGYVCIPNCVYPLSKTLHDTNSLVGNTTLSWVSGQKWVGTTSYTGGACGCAIATVTVTITVDFAGLTYLMQWPVDGSLCPGGPGFTANASIAGATVLCPLAFSITGSDVFGTCLGDPNFSEVALFGPGAVLTVVTTE
jgi:hypothetical protein